MLTVGQILLEERSRKNLSLEEVEKATKIRRKFLEALEIGDYKSLPPGTFTRGFVKNYATFLGLNPEEILAFYRRETSVEKPKVLPEEIGQVGRKFSLTPQLFTALGIGFFLLLFFVYLLRQYLLFASAPPLNIKKPSDYAIVRSSPLEITGVTDADAILTVNDQPIGLDETGNFTVKIDISPGLNTFTIISQNKFKKQSQVIRRVRLESP
ncbi:MAG: helix-turn-helix domain-containing protein [Patescibacteria group bacterium]